jgi:glyoxylase-like metal-dependent hydrolase (beta-lactamase superfamily II)
VTTHLRARTLWVGLVAIAACRTDATPVTPAPPVQVEAPPPAPTTRPIDPRVEQVRAAFAVVALGAASDELQVVVCQGDTWAEAHLPRPTDRIHATVEQVFVLDAASGRIEMQERAQIDGAPTTTRAIVQGDRIAVDQGGGSMPLDPNAATRWRTKLGSAFPRRVLEEWLARSHPGPHVAAGAGQRIFFAAGSEPPWEVFVGAHEVALGIATHDPIHGDVTEDYLWSRSNDTLRIDRRRAGELVEQLTCRVGTDPKGVARIDLDPAPAPAGAPTPSVEVVEIAAGVHAVEYRHLDHRSLVVEHDGGLTLVEAPVDAATGELLLATVAERWADRPIHRLVITHHHPDHAGGVRPFIARGIPIVTTPGNADYLQHVAAASWASAPDALWLAPRPLKLELVEKKRRFGGVEVFDIGPDTTHTAEYLVVWIAGARVLVHGDLVALPEDQKVRPAGPRGRGLSNAIRRLRLKPATLVGTWPLRGVARTMTAKQLRESVSKRPQS